MTGGNWGKVLKVDLTTGEMEDVEIPEQDYRDFLGGSGLAAKWFFDHQGWKAEPLSPENPLMIMNGPLSGTTLPGVSRLEICARSPLTGIWGEASMGGHFSPQLKRTGYDGIIVTGASDKPVYLYVTDDGAEIRDASHLWGKDTYETEELLKQEVGDKRAQVISIGPAGENLVKFACVMNDRGSTAGRCGMGAVMGSKKLKAVVARGNKKFPVADEAAFKQAREKMNELLKFSLVADGLRNFGSNVHMEYGMAIGDVPTKNWRLAYWAPGPEKLGGTAVAESILVKTHSCFACPISCKRIVEVKEGPFALEEGPGSEYEAAAALGTLQLLDDREANHKLNELCNRYGMDVISCGSTLAYATEAFEAGLIGEEQTGGTKLGWNQPRVLIDLVEKTARREGFGNDLAEGVRAMSEKYGGKEFAIHVKGLECPMHDPRALWAMALTYATSIRGACHCADANLYIELGILDVKELGAKRTWPYSARGKAAQTVAAQKKGVIANSAVICEYAWNAAGGSISDMAMMLNSLTGFGYSVDELAKVGDRIWYLKRALGNLMGVTREDDRLPSRILEPHLEGATSSLHTAVYPQFMSLVPIQKLKVEGFRNFTAGILSKYLYPNMDKMLTTLNKLPGFSGKRKKLEQGDLEEKQKKTVAFDEMIGEYYRLRDIDEQGRPSRRRLEELGLKQVADALHG
ncbi:MAG: aldehyde ferredoxin oxidoreductase family protein [Actinomycetota bacterium]|nr:aldehyde ferredoxin oxidoreductase family protein [Actinomycetota bacterium]